MAKGENIFKRKDGRWEARYIKGYELSGKIKYGFCYGKTYREAKEKVTKCKAALVNGKPIPSTNSRHSFAFYCDEWLRMRKPKVKESTYIIAIQQINANGGQNRCVFRLGKRRGINRSASTLRIGILPRHVGIAAAFIQKYKVICAEPGDNAVPRFPLLRHIGDAPVRWHETLPSSAGIPTSATPIGPSRC